MSEMSLGLTAAASQAKPEAKRYFFDVSVLKLIVMSTVTFGCYEVYWFYKNWEMAKLRGEDIRPLLRAIFAPLFVIQLFREVRDMERSASIDAATNASGLGVLYILLCFTWRLPDPLWLVGFATVIPLALVQHSVARIHSSLGLDPNVNNRFTWKNMIWIVIGGALFVLVLVGVFLPPPLK